MLASGSTSKNETYTRMPLAWIKPNSQYSLENNKLKCWMNHNQKA
jgi:hypothetical protein